MYVQALICSVGLKYYKHVVFSDLGCLLCKVACCLFERVRFVRLRQQFGPTCIASWVHTSASHEVYVHIARSKPKLREHFLVFRR